MQEIVQLSSKTITLARNQHLLLAGDTDTHVYHVKSGSLCIYVLDQTEQQIVRLCYSSNLIVALDSFLTAKPTQFYIQALKKTTLDVITKTDITNFTENQNNHKVWTNVLENIILQQLEREIDILTHSPKERYERVLKRSPQLFQEIPHKHIANYLRMSPETLSRLKKS